MSVKYDDKTSRSTEKAYQAVQIQQQRQATISTVKPTAGESGLDVGCGPGMLVKMLAEAVGPSGCVVGVDSSSPMLGLAGKRCARLEHVTLLEGSATQLPIEETTFDFVTCVQVLLYVNDVARALQEMKRVLRPGGRIYVMETDWRSAVLNCRDQGAATRAFAAWDQAVASPNLPARMNGMLARAGFQETQVGAVPLLSTTMDEYAETMMRQLAKVARDQAVVTRNQADEWLQELRALDEAGEFFFCVNRFAFTGRNSAST